MLCAVIENCLNEDEEGPCKLAEDKCKDFYTFKSLPEGLNLIFLEVLEDILCVGDWNLLDVSEIPFNLILIYLPGDD